MDPDLSRLDDYLDENDLDGYLIEADGDDSDQRYLSGFTAPDPFGTLYTGETHLLVSSLEYGRAKREARADTVERSADYDGQQKIEEYGEHEGSHRLLAEFLRTHDAESVAVPNEFPAGTADGAREQGIEVTVDHDGVVEHIRATKLPEELDHVRDAQKANERAMATAERLVREADVNGDGELVHDGDVLTSERVKTEIEISLLRDGYALDTTIVACGADAADPHDRGSGPLRADESIIVDIFPRSKETGYFADMTRTFVKGAPSDTVQEWYDLTLEAKEAALDALGPGVSGSEVHGAVCDVYEDAGLPTLRSDPETETGFIHTTGHGVGLDIHEYPRVSTADNELEPGHVVTIEPGLYDPEVGGVRIEDIVVVTEDGYENFTDYETSLVV
ncbi:M24 family metallopeptidase [Halorarius halobius]|uniref:M24 family metallopeptidase n=1 Tax=Halorarius halobius TaxID=2962671 RepID=UPI0020CE0F32|nr:Xaa-Pro peptidase family protein [Halorarius halobius]